MTWLLFYRVFENFSFDLPLSPPWGEIYRPGKLFTTLIVFQAICLYGKDGKKHGDTLSKWANSVKYMISNFAEVHREMKLVNFGRISKYTSIYILLLCKCHNFIV